MADPDYDVILTSVKKFIGPSIEYDYFDPDILMHINSYFAVMTQCGVGPAEGFHVTEESKWSDFLSEGPVLEMAKQYVYLRSRLTFDPPTSSFVIDMFKKNADEMEWRMYVQADSERRLNGF